MIRLEMENYNKILTEKQQKYQYYHQVKLININILQVDRYYLLIKVEWQILIIWYIMSKMMLAGKDFMTSKLG